MLVAQRSLFINIEYVLRYSPCLSCMYYIWHSMIQIQNWRLVQLFKKFLHFCRRRFWHRSTHDHFFLELDEPLRATTIHSRHHSAPHPLPNCDWVQSIGSHVSWGDARASISYDCIAQGRKVKMRAQCLVARALALVYTRMVPGRDVSVFHVWRYFWA